MREHLRRLSLRTTGFSNENLKIDDIKINFDLDKNVINSYNDKYKDISGELSGIKRFNVFRYFEDTNMLLPIETFHDETSGRVYAHTTETGTYCLIDMAAWLDSLGFENYTAKAERSVMTYSSEMAASSDIDIIFILYSSTAYADFIKDELANVISSAYSHGNSVHMYFISSGGDIYMINGREYAETAEECMNILKRFRGSAASESVNKAFLAAKGLELRDGSQRHMFMFDGLSMPACGSANANLNDILKNDVNFGIICNSENNNIVNYNKLANNNVRENIVVFRDFILDQINFTDIAEDEEYVITANGLVPMPEDFGDISIDSEQDYDRDGLSDVTEINFDVTGEDGNTLITVNDDGSVVLPNFNECVAAGGTYVEEGLKRFYDEADDYVLGFLDIIKVLPLISDPTSEDGDGDRILDSVEYSIIQKYSNNMVTYATSDEKDTEDSDTDSSDCPLGLLSSDTIVDYDFNTTISGKTLLDRNGIKPTYTLGYSMGPSKSTLKNKYGYLGYDNDVFYLEAYCTYDNEGKVTLNKLRINANIYCPEQSISVISLDDEGVATSENLFKDDIFKAICSKWGNDDEAFQGSKDDFFGMKVNVSVNINEILLDSDSSSKTQGKETDSTEAAKNKPNKRAISRSGELEDYKGNYATLNLISINPGKKKSITHNGLSSFPEIDLYNTTKTTSNKIKDNDADRVCATAAHEFGHILGLMDAYGFGNEYNYYMEPVSDYEIIYNAGEYGKKEAGEIMHSNGKVCANDIEMAIYARKTGEYQFFVPIGYTITTEKNDEGEEIEVRKEWGLSPAIRAEYEYRAKQTIDDPKEFSKICDQSIQAGQIYIFDPKTKKYQLKPNSTT